MRAVGENKRCSKCQEWKLVGEFYCNNRQSDGLSLECKACCKARGAALRGTEKRREQTKRYREKNAEKLKAYDRQRYIESREKRLETARLWRVRNLEKYREASALHSLRKAVKYEWMKEKLLELGVHV